MNNIRTYLNDFQDYSLVIKNLIAKKFQEGEGAIALLYVLDSRVPLA